jgi:hypothetical protein
VAEIGLIVVKLDNKSDKLDHVEIIDERMERTMAPGRAKEKMKLLGILKNWMTRLQYLKFLLYSGHLS